MTCCVTGTSKYLQIDALRQTLPTDCFTGHFLQIQQPEHISTCSSPAGDNQHTQVESRQPFRFQLGVSMQFLPLWNLSLSCSLLTRCSHAESSSSASLCIFIIFSTDPTPQHEWSPGLYSFVLDSFWSFLDAKIIFQKERMGLSREGKMTAERMEKKTEGEKEGRWS